MIVTMVKRKRKVDLRWAHLSERQREFMEFLERYEREHGVGPTFREIALGMGVVSKGSITVMIDRLLRHGVITRDEKGAIRGLKVSE